MEGATLLEKTKWWWNRSKTLKEWAMKAVQNNLHACMQIHGESYIQNKLSPQLRDDVLQELQRSKRPEKNKTEAEFISMKQSMLVFMSTMTKKLDLDFLMSFCPKNSNNMKIFIEVLKMVSIAAPNVRHLKINSYHIRICLDSIEFRNACLEFLSSMNELRILEFVDNSCSEIDLALLCRELPNLRILSAPFTPLEDANMSEEDIRVSFGHLRLLCMPILSWEKLNKIFMVLPNLDVIQNILPNGLTLEDFLEDENLPRQHGVNLQRI
ncbi:Hypothetical predicted protein [Cloeon dipterum]|uniref:Uncharacterized protein n=2 Tax=Cloeon dipterum TaxID=197152 RepID=A0A8S1DV43_9INSE|nr:Hypothetical predicted protein [Cloeon dipterum]